MRKAFLMAVALVLGVAVTASAEVTSGPQAGDSVGAFTVTKVAGNADDAKSWLIGWLQAGSAFALLQLGPRGLPWLADVPLAETLAANDTERMSLERLFVHQRLGLPFVAPSGLPAERFAALRAAFDAMTQDPAFLKEASQAGVTADRIGGDALERAVGEVAKLR